MSEKIGLVLEGGGFRGLYTEGVLETLIDKNIQIPYVIGVSMGSAVGSCYISQQKRRNYDIAMTYIDDSRYLSFRNMLTHGGLFGLDFVFQDLAYELLPFDFETFRASDQELVVGAMRCDTGETDYFYKSQLTENDLLQTMRASCSLPFVSKSVAYKGHMYLDGGISDSIPYKKAFEDGCDKLIVVLTRSAQYKRKPFINNRLGAMFYRDYPNVLKAMECRHIHYAETLVALEVLEREGKVMIIRPPKPITISRLEKDRAKLRDTFVMGYNQGKELATSIEGFINGHSVKEVNINPIYEQYNVKDIRVIKGLWERLNDIHSRLSIDFSERYVGTTFEKRTQKFLAMKEECVRITCAKDGDQIIAYCVSTVDDKDTTGDLASIYVDPTYRRMGIGEALMTDSKTWLLNKGCQRLTLGVSVGNESVINFYKKAGFYPRLVELEYKQ